MKLKLKVPTTLNDIKLSSYQRFIRETKGEEDSNVIDRKLISIFCNIPFEYVDKIASKDYNDILGSIKLMLDETPELTPIFKYNGVDYGFIPDMTEITLGEQVDAETFFKDVETWDKLMGVFYRSITQRRKDKYLIEEYKGDSKSLDVTLDIALGCTLFFYNLFKDCKRVIQNYIKEEADNPKISQTLEQSGVGIKTFTHSLTEIFSS